MNYANTSMMGLKELLDRLGVPPSASDVTINIDLYGVARYKVGGVITKEALSEIGAFLVEMTADEEKTTPRSSQGSREAESQ